VTIVPSIPAIPVAAWLTIEADKIKYFHLHFNPGAIVAAKERGEIAKALAGAKQSGQAALLDLDDSNYPTS
jgi:hypothetical protein